MRKARRTILLSLLAFLSSFPWNKAWGEPPWVTLKPPASISFLVSMPSEAHKLQGRDEWRATDPDGSIYSTAFGYYTEPQRIADPEVFMRMMVNRLAANTQSKIAYLFFFKYQDVPACEFKLVDLAHHRVGAGRYFLVHQWFYYLDLSAMDKDFKVDQAKKFFESFQIINPQLKDFEPGS